MNDNFKKLQIEVKNITKDMNNKNEKSILNFMNTTLKKLGSKLTVRKNLNIISFLNLFLTVENPEQLQDALNKLDYKKEYEIFTGESLIKEKKLNEEFSEDEDYIMYKNWLNSATLLINNLYVIEYN